MSLDQTSQSKKNLSKKGIAKKSLARLVAIQALYQYDFYNSTREISDLKDELIDDYLLDDENEKSHSYRDKIDIELLEKLISGIVLVLPKIDEDIEPLLQKNHEKISDVILQIIRLASFELKYMKDVPLKVVINEYVDIAGCFYNKQKVTFVNGILENIAAKNRSEEFKKIKNG